MLYIIQEEKIGTAKVLIDLIPESNRSSRSGKKLRAIKGITQHNTGNKRKGANAEMHTEYVDNTRKSVSWHFTVDDKTIYQELPLDEVAWHAGDGRNGEGNNTQIAIETCMHEDIDWQKARTNTIALIVILLKVFDLTPGQVNPHRKWNGKWCPERILNEGWDEYIKDIHIKWSKELFYGEKTEFDTEVKDAIIRLEKKIDKNNSLLRRLLNRRR